MKRVQLYDRALTVACTECPALEGQGCRNIRNPRFPARELHSSRVNRGLFGPAWRPRMVQGRRRRA
jgi:hypothetical protein